jgi:hypothetical protein
MDALHVRKIDAILQGDNLHLRQLKLNVSLLVNAIAYWFLKVSFG